MQLTILRTAFGAVLKRPLKTQRNETCNAGSCRRSSMNVSRSVVTNAAMNVFSLSHGRSRELYDLTMLEVRRVLYDDLPQRPQIPPGRLIGIRGAWMTRFDAVEFTKFVMLTKDLSPFVLLLIDPQSRSRRQDRNPAIAREYLIWVINGHPDAVPLFQ
jgi:hypothetical protein